MTNPTIVKPSDARWGQPRRKPVPPVGDRWSAADAADRIVADAARPEARAVRRRAIRPWKIVVIVAGCLFMLGMLSELGMASDGMTVDELQSIAMARAFQSIGLIAGVAGLIGIGVQAHRYKR